MTTRFRATAAGAAIAALALPLAASAEPIAASAEPQRFVADLRGENVAPEPVETDAHGRAVAVLDGNTLMIVGSFVNLSSELRDIDEQPEDPGIHIHPGAEGETNGYIYGMAAELNDDERSGIFFGTFDLSDEEVTMLMDERLYVDIHTTEYEDGELRDQLRSATERPGVAVNDNEGGGDHDH